MKPNIGIIAISLALAFYSIKGQCQTRIPSVKPDTALAVTYLNKGKLFLKKAEFDSSMYYFMNASEIFKQALNHKKEQSVWENYILCLTYIGKNFVRQMNFESASEYLHKALELGVEKLGENHIHIAFIYNGLATLNFRQSDLVKALEYDKKSLEINITNLGLEHHDVANGYYNCALTYQDIGDYDSALSCFMKSRDIYLRIDDPAVASAYYGIGCTYIIKGHYDRAFKALDKALAIRVEKFGEKHPFVAESYNSIGRYYKATGDLDKAIEYYKRSTSIYSEYFGPHHPSVAYGNNNIGGVYREKGNLTKSLYYYHLSLEDKIRILGENHPAVANTYANIGRTHSDQGNYQTSLQFFKKSLAIRFNILGKEHPSIVLDYLFMGSAYIEMSDYNKALDYLNKALDIQIKCTGEKHPLIAKIYNYIGDIHVRKTDYKTAITYFQKAIIALSPDFNDLNMYKNPDLHNILSETELLKSLRYKAESLNKYYVEISGNIAELKMSFRTYQLASVLIDNIRNGYKTEGSRLFLGEKVTEIFDKAIQTALTLYKKTKDTYYKEQAFQFAEKSKFSTLALYLQESRARQFAGIPDTLLQLEKAIRADLAFYNTHIQKKLQKKKSNESKRFSHYEDKLFTLNNQYQKLINTFEVKHPNYYDLKYQSQTITIEKLKTLLDDQTVLIEYFTGENTLTIFTFTKNQMNIHQTKADSTFYKKIGSLISSIKKIEPRNFIRTSVQLYKKIIAPVQNNLNHKKKIIIIPHSILAKVPFEVLISKLPDQSEQTDFSTMNYLIRLYDISYHYSATLYAKRSMDTQGRSVLKDFAGFAPVFSDDVDNNLIHANRSTLTDPDYSKSDYRAVQVDGKRFNELKYSEQEIQKIVQCFKKKNKTAVGYYKKAASENNFKAKGADYQHIHIASHGIVNQEYPQLSGIIFSQPGHSTSQEDGILYSGEIYNLNLNADLVVLSSCESGIGKLVKGEGLMALTRGFLYAGTENLLVSLWKVSDKNTSELMIEFYENILKGDDYSGSLRKAKLTVLKNPKTAFPRLWASFVLIGE